jgi:hypothetical protein
MLLPSQTKTNRSLGNAQSRLSAMPSSPAYGNTTNVNGAQTAVGGVSPQLPFSVASVGNGQPAMASAAPMTPAPAYPGGDAPGIASYYRNSALQGYQGGQQQQMSAMAGDVREATRNAQYMASEPQATSSTGANQIMARQPADLQNAVTARVGNSYNGMVGAADDPNRMTPDQKLGVARGSALAAVGGGAAADPTGMAARFGGAMGQQATSDAAAIQSGRAVRLADGSVSRFTGTPESATAAMMAGRTERQSLRDRSNMNVPQEELDRRKAADAQQRARSNRARAFESENEGLTYKHMDRLERKYNLKQKAVREGRKSQAQADAEMGFEKDKMLRRSRGRDSALQGRDQPRPLAEMPNRPNLQTQQPEVAKAAVETMVTQSPVIKGLGWTTESKPQDVMNSIASMNPQQMTSTQKFEAARQIHEYMLSQVESGNPDYAIEDGIASDGSDPRIGFIGLSGLKPGNKDAMVRWFDDLHRQSQMLSKSRPPAGTSPLAPLTPQETPGGFTSPRQGNPF